MISLVNVVDVESDFVEGHCSVFAHVAVVGENEDGNVMWHLRNLAFDVIERPAKTNTIH